jgi:hypothetical protein
MWVAIQDVPRSTAHPFYTRLNQIVDEHGFDECKEPRRVSGSPRLDMGQDPVKLAVQTCSDTSWRQHCGRQ